MNKGPLWATPERRTHLVGLVSRELPNLTDAFYGSLDAVVFGEISVTELMDAFTNRVCHDQVEYWKADDRDARSYLLKLEKRRLHALPRIRHRGEFDSIARDEYLSKRPVWEIVAIGVNPFTHGRVAKVAVHATHGVLWVDLSGIKKPSENQKRKYVRYGKGVAPRSIQEQIEDRVSRAVSHYLS